MILTPLACVDHIIRKRPARQLENSAWNLCWGFFATLPSDSSSSSSPKFIGLLTRTGWNILRGDATWDFFHVYGHARMGVTLHHLTLDHCPIIEGFVDESWGSSSKLMIIGNGHLTGDETGAMPQCIQERGHPHGLSPQGPWISLWLWISFKKVHGRYIKSSRYSKNRIEDTT